jgi:hypothetical protein
VTKDAANRSVGTPDGYQIIQPTAAPPETICEIPDCRTAGTKTQAFGAIPDFSTIDGVDPEFGRLVNAFLAKVAEVALTLELNPERGGRDDRVWRAAAMLGARPVDIGDRRAAFVPPMPERPATGTQTGRKTRQGKWMTGLSRKEAEAAMTVLPLYPNVVLLGERLDGNALALVATARGAMRQEGVPEGELDAFAKEALAADYTHVLRTVGSRVRILWKPRRPTIRPTASAKHLKENTRDKCLAAAV